MLVFTKKILTRTILIFIFTLILPYSSDINSASVSRIDKAFKIKKISNTDYVERNFFRQNLCPKTRYNIINPPREIKNLKLPGFESRFGVWGHTREQQLNGKIVRALRFQNITRTIEQKYNIPDNLLLAMVMLESGGIELLPNSEDDGGIGLCHMQPYLAAMFGLKTLDGCTELRSKTHGKKLRYFINLHNYEIPNLIDIDDRFHPIINLDAVARMLLYHKNIYQYHENPWIKAIAAYGGLNKHPIYYNLIKKYRNALNNKQLLEDIKTKFNEANTDLYIGKKKANFDDYIKYYWGLNYNYGLKEYKNDYTPFN